VRRTRSYSSTGSGLTFERVAPAPGGDIDP
jgi:hypothetical protein